MHPQSDSYPDYPDWQSGHVHDNKYLNIDIMLHSKINMIIRERKIFSSWTLFCCKCRLISILSINLSDDVKFCPFSSNRATKHLHSYLWISHSCFCSKTNTILIIYNMQNNKHKEKKGNVHATKTTSIKDIISHEENRSRHLNIKPTVSWVPY